MNCDEAFDALTSADSRSNDALQQHLSTCSRCRQMQEVLAPALSQFGSSEDLELQYDDESGMERSAEPLAEKFLSVEAVQLARETAQRLTLANQCVQPAVRRDPKRLVLQVASAVAGIAVLIMLFAALASIPARRNSATGAAQVCLLKDKSELDRLRGNSQAMVSACVACHFDK